MTLVSKGLTKFQRTLREDKIQLPMWCSIQYNKYCKSKYINEKTGDVKKNEWIGNVYRFYL